MRKIAVLLMVITILTGCASYKSIPLMNLEIGMSKKEVIKALKKKPDNMIGAKRYDDGTVEVLQYSRNEVWYGQLEERYWIYFFNDKLVQWGRPGDWQKEADRVYEIRNR